MIDQMGSQTINLISIIDDDHLVINRKALKMNRKGLTMAVPELVQDHLTIPMTMSMVYWKETNLIF